MKSIRSWNLEDSNAMGRLGLESLFNILIHQLYLLADHFNLEGRIEIFRRVLRFPLR